MATLPKYKLCSHERGHLLFIRPVLPKVLGRFRYAHPQFTSQGSLAQARHAEISSATLRTHFCGAYWRNGFHEDGVWSALRVAKALGCEESELQLDSGQARGGSKSGSLTGLLAGEAC